MNPSINFRQEFTTQTMLHELHELIAKANRLNLDTTTIESIYKDLNVLNLFSNRHIVSVAGLQSAGKTLLIKRTLDLPDDLLLSEVGVGEKRPVLLSSDKDATTITYRITRTIKTATGSFELLNESISKEALNTGIQNPSADMLWFEIILPKNDVLGHLTVALLPGFERSTRSDSQKFLDIFLKCSTGMILVLNHARLAQMDQEMLLQQVASTYKDKAPGFVLTHASELTNDKKTIILQNLFQKFNMDESSQVVLADTDIETVPQEMERLLKSNSQFSQDSLQLHHKKLLMIGETLWRELTKMEHMLVAQADRQHDQNSHLRSTRRSFEKARDEYIAEIDTAIKIQLDAHVKRSLEKFKSNILSEKSNWWDKALASFKKDMTFNERHDLQQSIKSVYESDTPGIFDLLMIESIESINRKRLNRPKVITSTMNQVETTLSKPVLSFMDTNVASSSTRLSYGEVTVTTSDTMQNAYAETLTEIDRYLNPNHLDVTLNENHIRQLPVIAGAIAEHLILTKGQGGDSKRVGDEMERYGLLRAELGDKGGIADSYSDLVFDANRMVTGTAIFFGVDALDGNFNSIGAVVSGFKALGLTAATANVVAVAGIGTIIGALAIHRGAGKIEKLKFERFDYAEQLLVATANYQRESMLTIMKDIMDEMNAKLTDAYQARRQDGVNLGLYEEIEIRVSRLKNECGKLREEAFRNAGSIY